MSNCQVCSEQVKSEEQLCCHLATQHAPAELSRINQARAARYDSGNPTGSRLFRGISSLPGPKSLLGIVLCVGLLGAVAWTIMPASGQSSPTEISDWTDLQAIGDSQANLSDDYVLVNDLNKSTAGYNAVVLNQTATEFTEDVSFDEGESRVNLTRTPVAKLFSNDEGLNLTVVDSANGTIERENTSSSSFPDVTYTTPTKQFVGFNPIGPSFTEQFTGSFDGQGNTIRDPLINRPTGDLIGLFGFSEGIIEQVTLANTTITGSRGVGGLIGLNDGNLTDVSASGAVTGSDLVGGLVGNNRGTLRNVSASGAVNGSRNVGGLVGFNRGTLRNVSASGAVTGFSDVGGLVGESQGTLRNVSASGAVNGSRNVGGLVGNNQGTLRNVSASGAVTGSDFIGGLVGQNRGNLTDVSASGAVIGSEFFVGGLIGLDDGNLTDVSASGAVTGSDFIGGLVGESRGTLRNVSASGAVNGSRNVGGLVGNNQGTLRNVSASGAVNGSRNIGGLVGENPGTVRDAYALGTVDGIDRVGGLVGENGDAFTTGVVERTYAVGNVTGTTDVGGLVGRHANGTVTGSYFDNQTTGQASAIGSSTSAGTTSNVPSSGLATVAMQGLTPTQAGQDTMDGLDFARDQSTSSWVAVVAGEEIPPTPTENGYPILQSLDVTSQLQEQEIDTTGGAAIVITADDVTVTGFAINAAEDGIIINADNVTITDNIINATGDGIIINGDDATIADNVINATGTPIVVNGNNTERRDNQIVQNSQDAGELYSFTKLGREFSPA